MKRASRKENFSEGLEDQHRVNQHAGGVKSKLGDPRRTRTRVDDYTGIENRVGKEQFGCGGRGERFQAATAITMPGPLELNPSLRKDSPERSGKRYRTFDDRRRAGSHTPM